MAKKLFKHVFSSGLNTSRPTKTITTADGATVTLVALPILPASPFRTVDARSRIEFSHDLQQLIDDHLKRGRRIALDIEHNTEKGADDTRSRGWSHGLTCDEQEPGIGLVPGLLYGWFELTPLGAQELADKLYGYTSGVALGFWLEENKAHFTRIKSLALTNNPATEMPMAFGADDMDEDDAPDNSGYTPENASSNGDDPAMLKAILEALGLTAETDEAAALAAVGTLKEQAAQAALAARIDASDVTEGFTGSFVANTHVTAALAQVTELTTQLTAARDQLAQFTAQARERDCAEAVTLALSARKITPAQKDAMLAFARADLQAFNAAMSAAAEVLPAGAQSVAPAVDAAAGELTQAEQAFCAAYGIKESSYLSAKRGNSTN